MSENTGPENAGEMTEKQVLQQRCRMMGIPFANATGVDKLRDLIASKMAGDKSEGETITEAKEKKVNALETPEEAAALTPREKMMAEQLRLVRLRITNLDPKKKDLPGEVLTIGNEIMGTVRKFIPFGEVTDGGYHVPYCLYQMMKDRKFLDIRTTTDKVTKQITVKSRWVREFALDVLEPLTQKELDQLAQAQLASGSVVDEGEED